MIGQLGRRRALLALTLIGFRVFAQEPLYMEAATHPGRGQSYARLLLFGGSGSEDGASVDSFTGKLKLAYGLRHDLAALLDIDFLATRSGDDDLQDSALESWSVRLKYRFFQHDFGPLNTWRASLLGGVELPGNHDHRGVDYVSPRVGVATTAILGRHGLNGQLDYTARRRQSDRLMANAAYLYRLRPARYTRETRGAWYGMLESLNTIGESGRHRHDIALGILYEARRWAWETGVRLPLHQDDGFRRHYEIGMGIRYLF